MKPFTEELKFQWELTPDSRVIDVGCFEGNWAHRIWTQYDCQIIALEPIVDFCLNCSTRLAPTGAIVLNAGLGANTRSATMRIHGGMTGMFASGDAVEVSIIGIEELLLSRMGWKHVDLIKLNCEGSEYEILEHVLDTGMAPVFRNIVVQPHTCVPDFESRWKAIQEGLAKTHECIWGEPWCWEGYSLIK